VTHEGPDSAAAATASTASVSKLNIWAKKVLIGELA
jgi:hypothetical protein